jgi:hypothetical protein
MNALNILKPLIIVSISTLLPYISNAADIDPSDLTQVNSFISGTSNDAGNINIMAGFAGAYGEGNNFLGLIDHGIETQGSDQGAQASRLRYFQVLDTGKQNISQLGFSIDYMKDWSLNKGAKGKTPSSDLVALGFIGKVSTGWQNFSLFPNIAYVQGSAKQEIPNNANLKVNFTGYQFNIFGSLDLGDAGYIIIQPQYMKLDMDNSADNADIIKVKTGYGRSLSDSKQWWAELSHTYTKTKAATISPETNNDDHIVELAFSYYF